MGCHDPAVMWFQSLVHACARANAVSGNGLLFDNQGLLSIERGTSRAQGRLRSLAPWGSTTFCVSEGSIQSGGIAIELAFPWSITLIAALGGALGASVHRGFRRVEAPVLRDVATGVLGGASSPWQLSAWACPRSGSVSR